MRDAADHQFLAEGIARYAEAIHTVNAFERLLEERLEEILKGYSSNQFEPRGDKIKTGSGSGEHGNWIWASQDGRLKKKQDVWLEIGLWWSEGEVCYYCCYSDDAGKAVGFTYKGAKPFVFKKWGKGARLFLPATKERYASMAEDFHLLLAELVAAFQ